MERDDIIALARAGFSAEQIAALAAAPAAPAAAPAEPTPAPAPAPAPAPPQAPAAPTPAPAPQPDAVMQLLERVGALTEAVQSSALLNTQQPPVQTADDILAAIIAPPQKGEK